MAEKRMAMAIAEMQVELSDRAKDAGGNAVGNLKMDYEMVDGSATLTVMAHADALVIPKKNPKGAGKKGTSAVGNTYAIDLIPKSSVKLRSMKDIKKDNKILHKWRDSSAQMKALWKKYSATGKGGSGEVFIASRTFKTAKYQMKKGQRWNPIKPPYTQAGRAKVKEQAAKKNIRMGEQASRDMKRFVRSGTLIPDPNVQRVGEVGVVKVV